mmetsp:Transcript_3454/g.6222  ORF Transcript_3454/g.6222 Transcript_3454/m.6222 type:complete len:902 (+) Transcript_3454:46-2751(+)
MAPDIRDVREPKKREPKKNRVVSLAATAVAAAAAAGRALTNEEDGEAAADASRTPDGAEHPKEADTGAEHVPSAASGLCCEWAFTFRVNYDSWRENAWQLRTGPEQIEYIDEMLAEALVERGKFPRHRLDLKIYETWLEFRIAVLNSLLELLVSQSGLRCEIFKSALESRDASSMNLLVLLHIPERTAWEHAQSQSYHLPLDANVARQLLSHAPRGQKEYPPGYAHFDQWLMWHYMDKHRDANGKERPLYQQRSHDNGSLFGALDQMRLIRNAMVEHVDMNSLISKSIVNDQFPLHSSQELARLSGHWSRASKVFSCHQPLKDVHAYFGEQIAFYFAWVGYQTRILTPFAVLGGIAEAFRYYHTQSWYSATMIHVSCGTGVVLWSVVYLRLWCRRERDLRSRWCPIRDDNWSRRQTNPNYRGEWTPDPVTGSPQRKYGARKTFLARGLSWSITGLCLAASTGAAFFMLELPGMLEDLGVQHATYITTVLNGLQIKIFDVIWTYCIVMRLVDLENWRYIEDQRNALIVKMFLFRAVNAFANAFWIAFVKRSEDCRPNCVEELRFRLTFVLVTYLSLTLWVDVMFPWIQYRLKICIEDRFFSVSTSTSNVPIRQRSYVERQSTMHEYDWLQQIEDYTKVTIQCGMVLLFFTVLPAIALLAIFSNLVKIRADAWKLTHIYRRPFPEEVTGVGAWNRVIQLLARLAMGFNAALVIFTTDLLQHRSKIERWLMLFVAERAAALLTTIVENLIPESSSDTKVTLKRHSVVTERLSLEQIGCKSCAEKTHRKCILEGLQGSQSAAPAKWPEYDLCKRPRALSDQLLAPHLRTQSLISPDELYEKASETCWALACCRRRCPCFRCCDKRGEFDKRRDSVKRRLSQGRGVPPSAVLPEASVGEGAAKTDV